ncbi:MAG: hypothetical protein Ct9H300mP13_8440 [Gammaproteobacteria bacterium]|nr:MAG: hypothetical protein Ct9H300mP13_8440 [Gammaproteobacteria bacterium]
MAAVREGAEVTLTALFDREAMTATETEVDDALTEGVRVLNGVMPIGLIRNGDGRAVGFSLLVASLTKKGNSYPAGGNRV